MDQPSSDLKHPDARLDAAEAALDEKRYPVQVRATFVRLTRAGGGSPT
jgi:hypothetical protein